MKPPPKEQAQGIHGTLVDDTGAPIVGANVALDAKYQAITDHRGRYSFADIAPGVYILGAHFSAYKDNGQANGAVQKNVVVTPGSVERVDLTMSLNYQAPAMPYGAPPSRRRVV